LVGKRKPGSTGKGNPRIAGTPGEAAMGVAGTKTFLGSHTATASSAPGRGRQLHPHHRLLPAVQPRSHFTDLGQTGTTGSPRSGASASSSPNWNGYPA
jgi:hypothetical protein